MIHGTGTLESTWLACEALHQLERVSALELLSGYERLVVLAPHPDDEVLGCGGLMMQAATAKFNVTVFAVTDGEAQSPAARSGAARLHALART